MVVVRSNNQENIGLANILKNLVGNSKAFRLYFFGAEFANHYLINFLQDNCHCASVWKWKTDEM